MRHRPPPDPPKPTPAQRLARWRRLFKAAQEIECRCTNPACQREAREIALLALDLIEEDRAASQEAA